MRLRASSCALVFAGWTALCAGVCPLAGGTISFHRSFRNGYPAPWHVTKAEAGYGVSSRNHAMFEGKVLQVLDGETLLVFDTLHQVQHTVRLANIDAPEPGQAYGTESRQHLAELVAGASVRVTWTSRDGEGRLNATLWIDAFAEKGARPKPSLNVNLKMVKDGCAWAAYGSRAPEYTGGMRTAKKARLGLWRDEKAQAPWLFRKDAALKGFPGNEVKK